jgi:hypothetical protein
VADVADVADMAVALAIFHLSDRWSLKISFSRHI